MLHTHREVPSTAMTEKSERELADEARTRIAEITPQELRAKRERGKRMTIVDVRELPEWNLFRIPGALHVPAGRIRDGDVAALPRDEELVLYCGRGNRSAIAADQLRERGWTRVSSLAGGIMEWVSSGGDVEE